MAKDMSDWSRFERLTPFRIRDVLLVASPFDFYLLEESGYLAEIMRQEYAELNLSQSPRIIHSREARDALQLIRERQFDLVITMARVGSMDVNAFGREVKSIVTDMPVILLSHNTRELATLHAGDGIDLIFVWTGDSRILLSICKLIEEEKNVADKAPVDEIKMNDLIQSDSMKNEETTKKEKFIIVISDFYYRDSAVSLKKDLSKKITLDNIYIRKINDTKYRLLIGPFESFNALKTTYISLNNLGFESLNIYDE